MLDLCELAETVIIRFDSLISLAIDVENLVWVVSSDVAIYLQSRFAAW